MQNKKHHPVIFLLNILLFCTVILLHYTDGPDISIATATPTLILPLLVSFSLFSSVGRSVAVGLICGIFMDSVSSGSYCFNALALICIAVFVSVASNNLFNKNIQSAAVLSLLTSFFYYLLYWLRFHSVFSGVQNSLSYLLKYALPSAVYTSLFIFPFYFLYKHFNKLRSE